jgi:hypothetical protein
MGGEAAGWGKRWRSLGDHVAVRDNSAGSDAVARIGARALHFGADRYGGSVFSNLLQLISRRSPPSYDLEFVREVRVTRRAPRSAKSKRLMLAGWILIALKCWSVVWAVGHYNVPVNPLWVTLPTVIFAGVCTLMYFLGE